MLDIKKVMNDNIMYFNNDDEFYKFCVIPIPVLVPRDDANPDGAYGKYADFELSPAYYNALEHGKTFMIKDENSQINKHGCVTFMTMSKPIENLEEYDPDEELWQ